MRITLLFVLLALFVFSRCADNNPHINAGQWIIKGTTYKPDTVAFDSYNDLVGKDTFGDSMEISFATRPTKNLTYIVSSAITENDTESPKDITCSIVIHTANAKTGGYYLDYSVGKAGDKIDVTISGNKVTASFHNIAVETLDTTSAAGTISGTLTEQ